MWNDNTAKGLAKARGQDWQQLKKRSFRTLIATVLLLVSGYGGALIIRLVSDHDLWGWGQLAELKIASGLNAFALLFIMALAIERVIQPISPILGPDSAVSKAAKDVPNMATAASDAAANAVKAAASGAGADVVANAVTDAAAEAVKATAGAAGADTVANAMNRVTDAASNAVKATAGVDAVAQAASDAAALAVKAAAGADAMDVAANAVTDTVANAASDAAATAVKAVAGADAANEVAKAVKAAVCAAGNAVRAAAGAAGANDVAKAASIAAANAVTDAAGAARAKDVAKAVKDAIATTALDLAGTEARTAEQQEATVADDRSKTALVTWAAATGLASLAAVGLNITLLGTVLDPSSALPIYWLDLLVTGLAVGAGTKPLNDLWTSLQAKG